jgi:hypothetical protein
MISSSMPSLAISSVPDVTTDSDDSPIALKAIVLATGLIGGAICSAAVSELGPSERTKPVAVHF